jgi:hypothetical protein
MVFRKTQDFQEFVVLKQPRKKGAAWPSKKGFVFFSEFWKNLLIFCHIPADTGVCAVTLQ